MEGEIRSIPGDRLVSRILTRARRRPRMGLSPDFYARFGMEDPWSAPEIASDLGGEGDGMVFLSAQPYYQMLRRLAAAQKRREKRAAAFAERRAGIALRAASRSWPGETAASLAVSRLARLAIDDMTLPPVIAPAAAPVPVETGESNGAARVTGLRSTTRTNRGASAWWSAPVLPRVERDVADFPAASGAADPRVAPVRAGGASHAGARLATASVGSGSVARALEDALPAAIGGARRQLVARAAAAIEALPPEQQAVEIRRVVRRLGGASPIVRTVYEDAPATRPASIAARRADPASSAGLRPVLSRSPAMAIASAPDLDRAATGTLATAERSEDKRGLAATPRRVSAARAASRASAGAAAGSALPSPLAYARAAAGPALAASPLAAALRSPAPAASAGGPARAASETGSVPARAQRGLSAAAASYADSFEAAPSAPARRATRLAGSARAVSRIVDAPALPEVATPAFAAVRGPSGAWVAARSLVPSALPPFTAARAAGTAHAAARVESGELQGRSVIPHPVRATPDRVLASLALPPAESTAAALSASPAALSASPVARAPRSRSAAVSPGAPIRTAEGAYVPARASVATPQSAADRLSARAPVSPAPDAPSAAPARWTRPASVISSARTLAPSALRTASPAVLASDAAAASNVVASPAEGRPSGVLHAASRSAARAPVAAAPVGAAPFAAPGVAPAPTAQAAATASFFLPRSAALAHASARVDLPAEPGLQPRVAPAERVAARADVVARQAARPARATNVAADRVFASPLLAASAANALADTTSAAPASSAPRFTRSGPLAWAQPAAARTASVESADAPAARGRPSEPARGGRAARRSPATRAYRAESVAPSSAVSAPGGVFMSARAAARVPGARLLRTEAGRLVAIVASPAEAAALGLAPGVNPLAGRAESAAAGRSGAAPRAPSNARLASTVGAAFAQPFVVPVDAATDALVAPPAPARRTAAAWAAARVGVADATAYRGALRSTDPVLGAAPAEESASEAPAARGAARRAIAATAEAVTPARRDRPRRVSASASAGAMALPTPMAPGRAAEDALTESDAASPAGRAAAPGRARRASLEDRLQNVASGEPGAAAPGWAARSDGRPMVGAPGGLFEALAKATTAEEIVRVIYARAEGVRDTALAREAPVVQVIEQIRTEVRREQAAAVEATRASRLETPSATVVRGQYVKPVASTTRVNRGGGRGVGATARAMGASAGDERITKLVKKLQGLIHLAEMEGRLLEAKRQVRLAEDSPGARAEGQGPVGASQETGEKRDKQDIESLGREVLEVVSREMELRRMRRLEDHDESVWW
jgi:hypothetical protein